MGCHQAAHPCRRCRYLTWRAEWVIDSAWQNAAGRHDARQRSVRRQADDGCKIDFIGFPIMPRVEYRAMSVRRSIGGFDGYRARACRYRRRRRSRCKWMLALQLYRCSRRRCEQQPRAEYATDAARCTALTAAAVDAGVEGIVPDLPPRSCHIRAARHWVWVLHSSRATARPTISGQRRTVITMSVSASHDAVRQLRAVWYRAHRP